jgi:hypothetical protein
MGSLGPGCATINETRTQRVLDEQSLRLSEQRAPDQREYSVSPRWRAGQLDVHVLMDDRCLVVFGERRVVQEKVERTADKTSLRLELAGLAAGSVVFLYGGAKSTESDGTPSGLAFVSLGGLFLAVSSGVAFAVDTKLSSDYEIRRTVDSPETEERMAPCSVRGALPERIELVTDRGRHFVSSIDGSGVAHFRLPADLWSDAPRITFSVKIDGRSNGTLELRQGP